MVKMGKIWEKNDPLENHLVKRAPFWNRELYINILIRGVYILLLAYINTKEQYFFISKKIM